MFELSLTEFKVIYAKFSYDIINSFINSLH